MGDCVRGGNVVAGADAGAEDGFFDVSVDLLAVEDGLVAAGLDVSGAVEGLEASLVLVCFGLSGFGDDLAVGLDVSVVLLAVGDGCLGFGFSLGAAEALVVGVADDLGLGVGSAKAGPTRNAVSVNASAAKSITIRKTRRFIALSFSSVVQRAGRPLDAAPRFHPWIL